MGFAEVKTKLIEEPKRWLVTGCAGFIGSHLVEQLLSLGQSVVGIDNFSTGHQKNLDDVSKIVGKSWGRFTLFRADILDRDACARAVTGIDYVLHQAALGSVPRSIEDPFSSHRANVDGFLNMILAARDGGAKRFVYASSSSVYGDLEISPKREDRVGRPLSPYAVTKSINELYANNFALVYGLPVSGLRYFNVFGPRQDPNGAYAAVVPRWINSLLAGEQCVINGDGLTSRDFCFVENVVQANILAALDTGSPVRVFNVALGGTTSLNDLYKAIRSAAQKIDDPELVKRIANAEPRYQEFRAGDIRHSLADIAAISNALGYSSSVSVNEGINRTVEWFYNASK